MLPEASAPEILYQDPWFVAVNKPAGLLVHRSRIASGARSFALQQLRDFLGQHIYPVHRLDRPTSGVLLFALGPEIAAAGARLFRESLVKKRYVAIVRGYTEETGLIDHPVKRVMDSLAPVAEGALESVTEYRRLSTIEIPVQVDRYPSSRYSLVELFPRTGRRHQLRCHMKHISHPIIGDTVYGQSRHNRFFAEYFRSTRLLLASVGLQFVHPATGEEVHITASPGEEFGRIFGEPCSW